MSGGGGSTSQKWEPPDYTKPGWQSYISGAEQLSQQPYQQYPGQQVAEPNQYQQTAWDLGTQRALYGAPDLNSARGMATDITGGKYLNSNPWLQNDYTQQVINQNADAMARAFGLGTAAQNDALAARAGAYGGSSLNEKQSTDAANLAAQVAAMANNYQLQRTNLGAQDYQQGIQQMLQGGNLAGNLSQDDWTAYKTLSDIGQQNQQYEQNMLNAAYGDWQNAQQYPYFDLDVLGNALSRASGGGTTTTQYPGTSPLAYLGAGLGLYGLLGGGFGK